MTLAPPIAVSSSWPAPLLPSGSPVGRTVATALAPAAWGSTYVVTAQLLPDGHPLFAAVVRALPAGLLAVLVTRAVPFGHWWWRTAVLGLLNLALFFPLLFVAAQRLPSGVAATLGAAQPIVVACLAVVILRENWSLGRLAAGGVGMVGVALVVLGPHVALDPVGVAAGLSATVSMATGVVLTKRWGRPPGVSSLAFAGWQLTAAGLILVGPAAVIDGMPDDIDGPAVLGFIWLGLVGTLLAYGLWFAGISRLPVTAVPLLGLLAPLVAALLGLVVAGETFTVVQCVGFALALAAMVAGQRAGGGATPSRPRRPRRHRSDVPPSSDRVIHAECARDALLVASGHAHLATRLTR